MNRIVTESGRTIPAPTTKEWSIVVLALRVAAEVFEQHAAMHREIANGSSSVLGFTRVADQFDRQRLEALTLAEEIDEFEGCL